MSDLRAKLVVEAVDRASGRLNEVDRSLSRLSRTAAGLNVASRRIAGLGAGLVGFGGLAATAAAATGGAVIRGVIETSAQFEAYGVQLEALEGSAEKARKALAWTEDFAKRTPLELADVVQSYAQLRTFGLDPTDGTMQALVDTMAKSGKGADHLSGIVLAVGQAWTKQKLQGEEALQLIERGVPVWDLLAKSTGKTAPKLQKLASAGKLGRKEIKLLIDAMGKSASGASDKFAKTWAGQTSMMADSFTAFKRMVGDAGVFDAAKDALVGFNAGLDGMKDSGEMARLAGTIGGGLTEGMRAATDGMKVLSASMGGADGAARMIGETFAAVGQIIGGVAQSAAWAAQQFDAITKMIPGMESFGKMPTLSGPMFQAQEGGIADRAMKWLGIGESGAVGRDRNQVTGEVRGSEEDGAALAAMAERRRGATARGTRGRSVTSAAAVAGAAAAPQPVEVGGKVQIEVTAGGGAAARVTGMSSTNKAAPISVDQGITMGAM